MKGQPVGKCRIIQDQELTAKGDLHRGVRLGLQLEEQRRGGHLPGAPQMAHPMSRLRVGVGSRVHDGPSQTIAWNRDGN